MTSNRKLDRRQFLKSTAATAAGLSLGVRYDSAWAAPIGANDDIRVAVVGLRGRGNSFLLGNALATSGVRVTALCDCDEGIMNSRLSQVPDSGNVFTTRDVRELMDRDDIDAILVGAPTHWHALMTIWACQSGKDVYCEKPVSHNVRESRLMALAANGHSRVLQIGTQRRSAAGAAAARDYLRAGTLGDIQWIHAYWYSTRNPVGLVAPWTPNFPDLDFDLYMGRAPLDPLTRSSSGSNQKNDVHDGWHWDWETGNGDLSNLGIHIFDQARFMADIDTAPTRIRSIGNRYNFNDAGQTPNIQLTLMDYPGGVPVVIENRGLNSPGDRYEGGSRNVRIQCENGYIIAFEGANVYNNSDTLIADLGGGGNTNSHVDNFFDAMRTRDVGSLRSPIELINPTNDGCLVGNASYRMGAPADESAIRDACDDFGGDAPDRIDRIITHLADNGVNLASDPLLLGPWLTFHEASARINAVDGATDQPTLNTANELIEDEYRSPYTIPTTNVPVGISKFYVD